MERFGKPNVMMARDILLGKSHAGKNAFSREAAWTQIKRVFVSSSAVILLLTGTAKVAGSFGTAKILWLYDPIFTFMQMRVLLFVTGALEVSAALFLLMSASRGKREWIIAWISTVFLSYRSGLWIIGYKGACPCFGTAVDWLPGTAAFWANVADGVFIYLLFGSYLAVVGNALNARKCERQSN